MAEPETDGIAEVFDDGMRLAITAAGRPAEQRIRERERQLREAQAESDQTARELQGRIDGAAAFGLAEWLSVMAVCRVVCRSPAQRSSPSGRGAIWSAKRTAGLGHKPPLRIYEVSSFLSICCLIPRRKRRQHEQLGVLGASSPTFGAVRSCDTEEISSASQQGFGHVGREVSSLAGADQVDSFNLMGLPCLPLVTRFLSALPHGCVSFAGVEQDDDCFPRRLIDRQNGSPLHVGDAVGVTRVAS